MNKIKFKEINMNKFDELYKKIIRESVNGDFNNFDIEDQFSEDDVDKVHSYINAESNRFFTSTFTQYKDYMWERKFEDEQLVGLSQLSNRLRLLWC